MITEQDAWDVSIYLDKYRFGFMISDGSQCGISKEGEFAVRYYGKDGIPSRQPMCQNEFSTKEEALLFIEEKLLEKAKEAKRLEEESW